MNLQTPSAPSLLTRAERLARKGDAVGAAALYRAVLTRFPANRRARAGLAGLSGAAPSPARAARLRPLVALFQSGQTRAALDLAIRLADAPVPDPAVLEVQAACLRKLGQPEAAIACYDRALQSHDSAALWAGKGAALLEAGRPGRAIAALGRATALAPAAPENWLNLARCKLETGNPTEALEAADRAVACAPGHRQAAVLRGRILLSAGKTAAAQTALEAVLKHHPDDAEALNELAILARATGDPATAERHYARAIALRPRSGALYRNLTEVTRFDAGDARISDMQDLLADETLPDPDRAQLHFALFNALDAADDTDNAFDHLARGNALRKAALGYDIARDAALFAWLKTLRLPEAPMGTPGVRPVFVTGLPRTGTTLTEALLAQGGDARAAGELPLVSATLAPVLRQMQAEARSHLDPEEMLMLQTTLRQGLADYAGGAACVIDKMPLNFRWIGFLRAALPEARFIVLERDPMPVGWSLYRQCFGGSGNGFAYDLADIARYSAMAQDLTRHWLAGDGARLHIQPYAELAQAPEDTARTLRAFCGIAEGTGDSPAPHRAILTASTDLVRQPIDPTRDAAWRRYGPQLEPLRHAYAKLGKFSNV